MHARVLVVLAVASLPGVAIAQSSELFVIRAEQTGVPSNAVLVGSSSLPDLASDLADNSGVFSAFTGRPFSATLDYAGVENAVQISRTIISGSHNFFRLTIHDIAGSDGTTINLIGTPDELSEQLKDFFLKDNPDVIKDFLAAIAEQSPVAVTDGNPLASTARSARYRFDRFGLFADASPASNQINRMYHDPETGEPIDDGVPRMELGSVAVDHGGFLSRVDFLGQVVEAGDFSGSNFDLTFSTEMRITERFGLVFGLPIGYHSIENADVFNVGLHLDAPMNLMIVDPDAEKGFSWTVTPGVSAEAVLSYDYAAGGTLYSFGLTNAFRYDYDKWTFIAAQQYTVHESTKLDVDDYSIDPGISQTILKLGGKVLFRMNRGAAIYAGATWTDFLEDAAVDNYTSPVAGFAWQFHNGANITLGYEGDFGEDYEAHGGRLTFQLPF